MVFLHPLNSCTFANSLCKWMIFCRRRKFRIISNARCTVQCCFTKDIIRLLQIIHAIKCDHCVCQSLLLFSHSCIAFLIEVNTFPTISHPYWILLANSVYNMQNSLCTFSLFLLLVLKCHCKNKTKKIKKKSYCYFYRWLEERMAQVWSLKRVASAKVLSIKHILLFIWIFIYIHCSYLMRCFAVLHSVDFIAIIFLIVCAVAVCRWFC